MLDINLAPRSSMSSGRRGHRGDAKDTENIPAALVNYQYLILLNEVSGWR